MFYGLEIRWFLFQLFIKGVAFWPLSSFRGYLSYCVLLDQLPKVRHFIRIVRREEGVLLKCNRKE
jgi:hypothetical protein